MTTLNAAQIQAALQKLDVNNDNHWTADGLPRLDTVKMLAGDQSLTRELVTQAAPGYTRTVAVQGAAPIAPPAPPAAVTDPAATPPEGAAPPPPPPPPPPAPPVADPEQVKPVSTTATTGLPNQSLVVSAAVAAPEPVVDTDAMKARLEVLQGELAEIARAEAEIKAEKQKRTLEADDLIVRIGNATPKNSNQQDIMAYLESQKARLAGRAHQIRKVKEVENELGVKLADLVPKRSPLDSVMARKTGYGRNRPGG